jgi:NADPH:quinone reductase-like Zn-dependent oxidoreductase
MKAMVLTGFGDAGVLQQQEWATPKAGPGQVLIKVHACSVNPIDYKIRKGQAKSFVRTKPPMVIGADISGEIAGLGAGASRFKVGDLVYAKLPGDLGGYAEMIALDEAIVGVRPKNLTALEAAGVPA